MDHQFGAHCGQRTTEGRPSYQFPQANPPHTLALPTDDTDFSPRNRRLGGSSVLAASMVQSASHTTSKAHKPVVAATTRATAMIVPTVIVQTPVCERIGLGNEVVGKRARMLTHQIRV